MAHMDVFNSDAFRMGSMTAALNKREHQPQLLGSLNLFTANPVRTSFVSIEERDGGLALIPTSPRGAPPEERDDDKRKVHRIDIPRLAKHDRITADEIQDIRAFGSESELQQVQTEVARRMNGPTGLMRDVEMTWENMRLGAIQGQVLDADGSTIVDWYNVFGVSANTEIAFDLDNAADGDIKQATNQVIRQMQRNAKGAWTPQTEVVALCGDTFYDKLTQHSEVRDTFKNLSAGQSERLRNQVGMAFDAIRYGGITWINYRGTDDGSTIAVGDTKAKFFPMNAPGVFQVAFAPAESFDYVNTPGQPVYAMVMPDEKRNAHVDLEVFSYPLFTCTRPTMLQSGRSGA